MLINVSPDSKLPQMWDAVYVALKRGTHSVGPFITCTHLVEQMFCAIKLVLPTAVSDHIMV